EIDGRNRIITDETNKDVTQLLEDEIYSFIKKYPDANMIVLKSKSPSCGVATTPILNEKREKLYDGDGIAAEIFKKKYPTIEIKSELNL
ncbi:MAG: 2-thiouracil desulfurase family protein, partial [Sulfurimonas sp.]|nr:2-thiouracil desulfurase family protein [Sulfurimonas sp.]